MKNYPMRSPFKACNYNCNMCIIRIYVAVLSNCNTCIIRIYVANTGVLTFFKRTLRRRPDHRHHRHRHQEARQEVINPCWGWIIWRHFVCGTESLVTNSVYNLAFHDVYYFLHQRCRLRIFSQLIFLQIVLGNKNYFKQNLAKYHNFIITYII